MQQLYLAFAAIIIFIITRRIYKTNFELLLIVFVIMNYEFFHLLHIVRFSSLYRLMIVPILLLGFFELIMQKRIVVGKYGNWVKIYFAIIVLGLLISVMKGQPVMLGIKAVKFYVLMMIYFYVVNNEVNIDRFVKYFVILALVIAGLAFLQVVFQDSIKLFATLELDSTRKYRITEGGFLIAAAVVLDYSHYLKKRGKYYLYAFYALFAHLVFIVQTRMLIIGVVLTCTFLYLMSSRFSFKSVATFVFVILIISIVVISFVPIGELAIVKQTMVDIDDDKETSSSIGTRFETYKYYIGRVAESPIFGYGFQSFVWRGNDEFLLQRKGFHLADVGIVSFVYKTGLIGFIWLMAGLVRLVVDIMKAKELPISGAYIILGITVMATLDIIMSERSIFMFGLFLGIMSNEHMQSQSQATNK